MRRSKRKSYRVVLWNADRGWLIGADGAELLLPMEQWQRLGGRKGRPWARAFLERAALRIAQRVTKEPSKADVLARLAHQLARTPTFGAVAELGRAYAMSFPLLVREITEHCDARVQVLTDLHISQNVGRLGRH